MGQSHKETLVLCAIDLVKLVISFLVVHCYVHLEQVDKTVMKAVIISDLHRVCYELGVTYSHFADSAYPVSRYMQAIFKNPIGGSHSAGEQRFNVLMVSFRIVIENLFAVVTKTHGPTAFLQQETWVAGHLLLTDRLDV